VSFRPTITGGAAFRRWGGQGPELAVVEGGRADEAAASRGEGASDAAPAEPAAAVDVDALVAEAEARGRAEGKAEAEAELAEARAEAEAVVAALSPALAELEALRREALAEAAGDVAELVLLFARRVVDRSLALHPEALPSLVLDAVGQLPDRDEVTIAVAPHLAEGLTRSLPGELRDRVVADIDLENGAVVRTRFVCIEATLKHATEGLDRAVQTWLSEQWWAVGDNDLFAEPPASSPSTEPESTP